ncbi:MAG: RluA family pseudouridine synthase [Verrucomicrobia bacterium]|nr:RluA family pseudouridine synthase [Verrucomicrobiota bacterium]
MSEPLPRIESILIEASLPQGRLDSYLHSRFPCVSRNTLQRLIRAGAILVDGQGVKPTHHPVAGQTVTIHWPVPAAPTVAARALPLHVVHEDEALLVLDKAAGMVVHPAYGNEDNTLVNALLHHCQGQLSGVGGVARPGLVHRLDQFTSGLMVVAKDDAAHLALSYQFAQRQVAKVYHALVCGELKPPEGEINAAIARHPNHRKVMTVLAGGRTALTTYCTLDRLGQATLAEARLHTGRTHQVRVHFKYLGHPLVGDQVYGKRQNARLEELTRYHAPRQMLHAQLLGFNHPRTGLWLEFKAPWPEDFVAAVRALQLAGGANQDRMVGE